MEDNKKLGQEPAYPTMTEESTSEYAEIPPTLQYQYGGMSKRFYAACKYSDVAYEWADGMSRDICMDVLGLPKDTKWNYLIHFPMVIIRLQYALADELLKQENQ